MNTTNIAFLRARDRVFCALDTDDRSKALGIARLVAPYVGGFKVGLEFFGAHGPDGVRAVATLGRPIFLDLKLHDIPNTVAGAVRAVAPLAPALLTIHASGGSAMMRAAAEAATDAALRLRVPRMRLLGVTVLTSLDATDLAAVGQGRDPAAQVQRLAELSRDSGLDGIVCAPPEAPALRRRFGSDFILLTPGVRPEWSVAGDQKRVTTPRAALENGSTYLVVGRPITDAPDPAGAAARIASELEGAHGA